MGKVEKNEKGNSITKGDLTKVFWRSFPLQACFNYERMQNVGFCYSLLPIFKKLYPKKEDMSTALKRHLEFFNTTPQTVTFITGACIALEEQNAKADGNFDMSSIAALKAALMGPIAGIGDSFFWGTFRIIAAGIGCSLATHGSILGPILFLLIFNIPHYMARYYGLKIGYKGGIEFIANAQESGMVGILTNCAKVMGLCVVGAMIASMVKFTIPFTISITGATIKVQSIFDQILPSVLPLILTFIIYMLLKKGIKTTHVMFGLIIIGILGSYIGVL